MADVIHGKLPTPGVEEEWVIRIDQLGRPRQWMSAQQRKRGNLIWKLATPNVLEAEIFPTMRAAFRTAKKFSRQFPGAKMGILPKNEEVHLAASEA